MMIKLANGSELDTENVHDRGEIRAFIRSAGFDELRALTRQFGTNVADSGAKQIWNSLAWRLTTDHLDALTGRLMDGDFAGNLLSLACDEAVLEKVAGGLPRRNAGELPHPMVVHLLQRLGDAKRRDGSRQRERDTKTGTERHPIRARHAGHDPARFGQVGGDHYRHVILGAHSSNWLAVLDVSADALKQALSDAGKDVPSPERTAHTAAELLGKVEIKSKTFERQPDTSEFASYVEDAWSYLSRRVAAEVLDLVELPEIVIYGPVELTRPDEDFPLHGASYTPRTRTIHIKHDWVTAGQLQHEFGHHIEEQGPIEVWCGLVAYLQHHSQGRRLLNPPEGRPGRVVRYDCLARSGFPLSKLGGVYGASYYHDAGTELLAMALQKQVLDDVRCANVRSAPQATPATTTAGDDGAAGTDQAQDELPEWDPGLLVLLLQAFRPELVRQHLLTYPALLPQAQ